MMARLAIALLLALLYAWVIIATWPYRMQVLQQQNDTDYYKQLDRQLTYSKSVYEELKANPNASPDEVLNAQERYALFSWEKLDFVKAKDLFQDLVNKLQPKEGDPYSDRWAMAELRLAGIYRDTNLFDDAEKAYTAVLDYDKKQFEKSDPNSTKISRDINNLGLLCYMRGTSEQDEKKRSEFLNKSAELLNDAIKRYQAKLGPQSPSEGISLWNLYLVERDRGNLDLAKDLKLKAEAIDAKMNRVVKAP